MPNFFNNMNSYQNNLFTVLVHGEEGANMYPVAAGGTVLLMDFDSKKFWVKSTDPSGMQQTLRTFDFTERIIPLPKQEIGALPTDYVTRTEFNDLKNYLESQFNELKKNNHRDNFKYKGVEKNDKSNA